MNMKASRCKCSDEKKHRVHTQRNVWTALPGNSQEALYEEERSDQTLKQCGRVDHTKILQGHRNSAVAREETNPLPNHSEGRNFFSSSDPSQRSFCLLLWWMQLQLKMKRRFVEDSQVVLLARTH